MATHLINDFVEFDDELCELRSLIEPERTIGLGATASRCLVVLLRARGEVVTKRALLYEAWERYGSIVTGNSANQAVAKIRKVFQAVGLDYDPILTVPRIGYKFSDSTRPSSVPDVQDRTQACAEPSAALPAPSAPIVAGPYPNLGSRIGSKGAKRERRTRRRVGAAVVGGMTALNLAVALADAPKPYLSLLGHLPRVAYVSARGLARTFGLAGNSGRADQIGEKVDKLEEKLPRSVTSLDDRFVLVNLGTRAGVYRYFICHQSIQQRGSGCLSHAMLKIAEK